MQYPSQTRKTNMITMCSPPTLSLRERPSIVHKPIRLLPQRSSYAAFTFTTITAIVSLHERSAALIFRCATCRPLALPPEPPQAAVGCWCRSFIVALLEEKWPRCTSNFTQMSCILMVQPLYLFVPLVCGHLQFQFRCSAVIKMHCD